MQDEKEDYVERHPGQVEEGAGAAAGQEAAQLLQIAKGRALSRLADQAASDIGGEDQGTQPGVQLGADAGEQARPHLLDPRLKAVENKDEDDQGLKGGDAAAGDDPVIDLQHEQRAAQHQYVDRAAEDSGGDERRLGRPQGVAGRRGGGGRGRWLAHEQCPLRAGPPLRQEFKQLCPQTGLLDGEPPRHIARPDAAPWRPPPMPHVRAQTLHKATGLAGRPSSG